MRSRRSVGSWIRHSTSSAGKDHDSSPNSNDLGDPSSSSLAPTTTSSFAVAANNLFHVILKSSATEVRLPSGEVCRPLREGEIRALQLMGNRSTDWSKVKFLLSSKEAAAKDYAKQLEKGKILVANNMFHGVVALYISHSSQLRNGSGNDNSLPVGIFGNGLIRNCIIDVRSTVHSNTSVMNTYIGKHAFVSGCGVLNCNEDTDHGTMTITVGAERSGGRVLKVVPSSDMVDLSKQLLSKTTQNDQNGDYSKISESKTIPVCRWNVIEDNCVVRDTPTIEGIYMSTESRIVGASSLHRVFLMSHAEILNGAVVNDTTLQWNASIKDNSSVEHSFLMEHAHVGPQSMVSSCVLGPDVHVSFGEVHSCLVGPNTNAHHQSLLIASLWPLGRGNIGYGANVGSNHTGRIPDQESCIGEGVFWGLSSVIKFPIDLSHAMYSIVAAGTTLTPQRITMPFSLIMEVEGVNQIVPGWVLQSSPYTLDRSASKYLKRRKAKHHMHYTGWKIIRPSVVDICIDARTNLLAATSLGGDNETYKCAGIGSSVLTKRGRQVGIQAYTDCIQRYVLRGLLAWCQRQDDNAPDSVWKDFDGVHKSRSQSTTKTDRPSWPSFPWENDGNPVLLWQHQKRVLVQEFPKKGDRRKWMRNVLQKLVELEHDFANRVAKCKRRDDVRGASIIPDYEAFHEKADDDEIVQNARSAAAEVEESVNRLLNSL